MTNTDSDFSILLKVAYELGIMRGNIRQMAEGEWKSCALREFDSLVEKQGLDVLSEGPIRRAFREGSKDAYRNRPTVVPPWKKAEAEKRLEKIKADGPKRVAYFADGTGNGFDVDPTGTATGDVSTNVLKLFGVLAGTEARNHRESTRLLENRQAVKYMHGVGNDENWFSRQLSGCTGRGLLKRVIEGYTFLSRHYEEGAHVVLVGFSRGAYTARALADWIAAKGLLHPDEVKADEPEEQWYKRAAASMTSWQKYRARQYENLRNEGMLPWNFVHGFENILARLPPFFQDPEPKHVDVKVRCVAVWDTVGSLGLWNPVAELPPLRRGHRPIRRPDTVLLTTPVLDNKVQQAWHAVSLDEDRVDFTPSLWDARAGVVQRLFPGVHSDVGGGYKESGLSDLALQWIYEQLKDLLLFHEPVSTSPDPISVGHRGWDNILGKLALRGPRSFAGRSDLEIDHSVQLRMRAPAVQAHMRANPEPYRPRNLPC